MSAGAVVLIAIAALLVGAALALGFVLRTIKRAGERR